MDNDETPLLVIKGIAKDFGATRALSDINLVVKRGEIHSLLGRNGAGKSTLVNIVAGLYPPSSGTVYYEGKDITSLNIFERQKLGIQLVPQHENSFPDLTVGENIFAGVLPRKHGLVDWDTIYSISKQQLAEYGLHVDPKTSVRKLSSIDTRKLNIIRAIYSGAKLIILDEPTTALTNEEREELFSFVRSLQSSGTAFIFISHYLGEVIRLSDSITVLRDGHAYPVPPEEAKSEKAVGDLVAGSEVKLAQRHQKKIGKDNFVSIKNLVAPGLDHISLDISRGEVIGVVGFPGSGAREFCRTLFGISPISEGEVRIEGSPVHFRSPESAISEGIGYVSYDRNREGLMPTFDVKGNVGISSYRGRLKAPCGFIRMNEQKKMATEFCQILHIKCRGIDAPIDSLSGGNQQKVLIARLLGTIPELLILDEPTIGIDIQSREEIISTILNQTAQGMSAIYLTNDFEELVRVTDRLVFFANGKITSDVVNEGLVIDDLIRMRDYEKRA